MKFGNQTGRKDGVGDVENICAGMLFVTIVKNHWDSTVIVAATCIWQRLVEEEDSPLQKVIASIAIDYLKV